MADELAFECVECATRHDGLPADCACDCGGVLRTVFDRAQLPSGWRDRPLSVWRYREFYPPLPDDAEPVTLDEGGTPLIDAPRIAEELGVRRVQLKFEGQNPTGSFKDRGMTYAVTWGRAHGKTAFGCASTGNTSASLAAYAARAGLPAYILLPAGKVALGKIAQTMAYGARILEVDGNFDRALEQTLQLARDGVFFLLNSKNPLRLEGQKSLLYEALDQRGLAVPDRVVYPVGNAGNITAGHQALKDYENAGLIDSLPRLTGVQAEGASPVARAVAEGRERIDAEGSPETVATAIRIGNPVSATRALRAIRETHGTALAVPDDEIQAAQKTLAQVEGVLVEPASAATIAGLRRLATDGALDAGERIVCVLTGHGLKDPKAAEAIGAPMRKVPADVKAIRAVIGEWDAS